ncbi:hypothetical protein NDI52_14070 [Leptolyngbya sp. PL-A3]|uniref:hypothetical protein n=1 Tax=Leptolyngbya sp. PL-A3 TaxID=2933911 RepID=UPI003299231C
MFTGLRKFLNLGVRFFRSAASATYVGIRGPQSVDPASSYYLELPDALPASTQMMVVTSAGKMQFQAAGGGGSVTSVDLTAPSFLAVGGNPVTTAGTLTLTLDNQNANTFFAGPTSGGAATPGFRAIAWADVSFLAGTSGTSFTVGNDSRLHTQNTDTGTTQASFSIDSTGTGVRLKNSAGTLLLRNLADSGYASLEVENLIVRGTTTTINSETMAIADNTIVLNSDVTGTPSENAGIQVERGNSTDATLLWDESNDRWMAGLAGAEVAIARVFQTTFTNATLVAGVLTVTHNLGNQCPDVRIIDNSGKAIGEPDEITYTSTTALTCDFSSFGALTGTWRVTVVG